MPVGARRVLVSGRGSAGGNFPGAALILTWTSLQTDLTPTWQFDYDDVAVNDVVTLQRADDSAFTTNVTSYTDTIDSISPVTTLDFATGNWAEQTWYVRAKQTRGSTVSGWSNTETILISSDVTAPVLSSPTDTNSGSSGYSGSVSTDEGNGTLYWVVSTSASAPTATQIIAGQMHTGAAAADADSQAVSGTGVQNISGTGLSTNTQYYIHYVHRDAANNNSNVASADGFSTDVTAPTLSSPVDASASDTTGSGSVSTNEGNGTLYFVVSTSGTPPSAAQVKAGQMHTGAAAADSGNQAVSGTGVQSITGGFTGLTAATAYTAHYMHEDLGGNQSSVSSGDGFTTEAGVPAFDVSYIGSQAIDTDSSTYSFTNGGSHFAPGAATGYRKILIEVVAVHATLTFSYTSIKVTNIDGAGTTGEVTATLVTNTLVDLNQANVHTVMAKYEAAVPSGTTSFDVEVVTSLTTIRSAIGLYRIINGTASSGGTTSNGFNTTLNTGSSLDIPSGGVGIVHAYSSGVSSFNAWTNLTTEDWDSTVETTRSHSGGRRTTAGTTQVTANTAASGSMTLSWCAYS